MMAMTNRVSELRKSQERLFDNGINLGEINIETNDHQRLNRFGSMPIISNIIIE